MKISLAELEKVLQSLDGIETIPSGFVFINGLWYNADRLLKKICSSREEASVSESQNDALEILSTLGFKTVKIRPEPFEREYSPITPAKSPALHEKSAIIRDKTVYRSQVEQLIQRLAQENVPFSIRKYYVEYMAENGNVVRVPPKDIIAMITGSNKRDFITSEAIRVIERLGFSTKNL